MPPPHRAIQPEHVLYAALPPHLYMTLCSAPAACGEFYRIIRFLFAMNPLSPSSALAAYRIDGIDIGLTAARVNQNDQNVLVGATV